MDSKIIEIKDSCNTLQYNYAIIKKYKEDNESLTKRLKELANDADVKKIICDNLHIEDNGEPRELESWTSISSSSGEVGETEEHIFKYPNSKASFNPELDEFEIDDFEVDEYNNKYRIMVECIRRRKFLLYNMWEPDYYWTDWIDM